MPKFNFNIIGHCLVTGSSSGIGKAIALEFASKGVSIIAVSKDKGALVKLKHEITSDFDVDCYILNKDLLDEKSPNEIVYTNPHVVQRISSGGIIAKWTSLSVGRVSFFIVNSMLKGKKTIVPGIGAKFLLFLMRVLPESLNILIAGRTIKKNEG